MLQVGYNSLSEKLTTALPLSKSLLAREFLLDYVLDGSVQTRRHYLDKTERYIAEDIVALSDALIVLEGALSFCSSETIVLDCKQSGTALRFLATLAPFIQRKIFLRVEPQLRARPMGAFLQFLEQYHVRVDYFPDGWLIDATKATPLLTSLDANAWESSQFTSGLMLVTPLMAKPWCLLLSPHLPSQSYIEMTRATLFRRGLQVKELNKSKWLIPNDISTSSTVSLSTERDWSAAHSWFQLIACHPLVNQVEISGLSLCSSQPDASIHRYFTPLGVEVLKVEPDTLMIQKSKRKSLSAIYEADLRQNLDLFPALVLTLISQKRAFKLSGVMHLRYKESDRIQAVQEGLERIGFSGFNATEDTFSWDGSGQATAATTINDRDDHRITMAFAIYAVSTEGMALILTTPDSVKKSYPNFWSDLGVVSL